MTNLNKGAVIAVVVLIVTNPLSGQYIWIGLEAMFTWIFQQSGYFSALGTLYMMGFIAHNMYKNREQVKVPGKSKKTEAQKYLLT